ncbi:MAG: hypothetical protein WD645_00285 [Dehalococcoidia bacterium]
MLPLAATLLASLAGALAGPLAAQTGLTVDPGHVEADQPLPPGGSYPLPAYTVSNGGSRDLTVAVTVSGRESAERSRPPADWFQVDTEELVVPGGQSRPVQVTVTIPPGAPEGSYAVWFAFAGTPVDAQGMSTGASVEVPFVFDVAPPGDGLALTGSVWLWTSGGLAVSMAVLSAAVYRRRQGRA